LENLKGGYKKLEAAVKEGAKGFACKEEWIWIAHLEAGFGALDGNEK
jgi:hypothetical protein